MIPAPLVAGISEYAIVMLDPQGRVTTWNAGARRIEGYEAGEIIGEHFSRFYTPEDREAGLPGRGLDAALRHGKYVAEGWRVRKDGSRFMAGVVIEPLRDGAGVLLGFAKITRDDTELARVAHDFNNVLHVAENGIEVLRRRLPDIDARTAQVLDLLKRKMEEASRMMQQLLSAGEAVPPSAAKGARKPGELAGLRVLVVEDESLIGMLIEDLLGQLDCSVTGAQSTVRGALEALELAEIDLALLDVDLGGEPVYPVAEALRARGVPFVFMSGYGEIAEPWRAQPSVSKPCELEQLRQAIERAVGIITTGGAS